MDQGVEGKQKVVEGRFKVKEKIFYCMAGMRQFAVPEKYILWRDGLDGFVIKASRVFAINIIPSPVISPSGQPSIDIALAILKNVKMECNFISEMSEEDQVYKEIMRIGLEVIG